MENFTPILAFLLVSLVVGGVVAIVLAASASRRKQLNAAFGALARQYSGTFHEGGWFGRPSVAFEHQGNWVRVDIYSTGGKHPTHYTQVHIGWPEPAFRMEVYPEGFFQRVGKFLGMQDVQIGSPQFDRDYIVTTNDPARLRDTLTPEAQSIVDALRNITYNNNNIYVAIRNRELLVKKLGILEQVAPLLRLTELALRFHEIALTAREKGIQFVDAAISISTTDEAASDAMCQVCGEAIRRDVVYCRGCKTPHHHDCWEYYGKCSTFGCGEMRSFRPRQKRKSIGR